MRGGAVRRALALGRRALADLRTRTTVLIPGFPLGRDGTADLELRRFEPFAPGARVEAVDGGGVRAVKLPDHVYFTGTVRGEPDSRVLLIAARDHVRGFVAARGTVYPFGPDRRGRHRTYALRDVDPAAYPPPGNFCANDLHRDVVESPLVSRGASPLVGRGPPPVAYTSSGLVQADAAIETDYELWAKFGSDSGTLDYLASLAAAVSAIDERDLSVRLRFSYIRLWPSTSDPWSATATDQQLAEVRNYWTNPANNMDAIAGPHALVHFISGKAVQGGIAYIGTVCDPSYFFGVSQVYGSFNLSDPAQIWDVLVVTHEIGHNLGTPHTHCYGPPVDECYNQEAGCYAGPIVCSRGTIMSYCHLNCGGLPDMDLVFGNVVSAQIRSTVAGASCLTPVGNCGNGVLDPGEQCDGTQLGAASCTSLGYASGTLACSADCTFDTSQCVAALCGDGVVEHGEACDPGGIGGAPPSFGGATCASLGFPGGGNLTCVPDCTAIITAAHCSLTVTRPCTSGADCPAGETCAPGCTGECKIIRSGQTFWLQSLVSVQRGAPGRDRLSLKAEFAISNAFGTLDPGTSGISILVEDGVGNNKLTLAIPPGARWVARRGRWLYRDPAGSAGGVRKLEVVDDTRGGVPGVQVKVTGRNGSYPLGFADLPLAVTVLLGDARAGQAGSCGRRSFDAGSCTGSRRGTRLVCH